MAEKTANSLGSFLREVANWNWEEFCLAENNPKYTTNESMIFTLVRACAMQQMDAIKLALNRIDGKLKTPIKVEFPKVFYLYPNAKIENVGSVGKSDPALLEEPEIMDVAVIEEEENDLPSLSLRQTLIKMSDAPREVPDYVLEFATRTQQWLAHPEENERPEEIPLVKSVIAAHLLMLAKKRNIAALTEVFDQIDGKLVETIQILGDDIFITNYSTVAPEGAYVNKSGILEIEAIQAQNLWAAKLEVLNGR